MLHAQQPDGKSSDGREPIELPEFIITGKAEVGVPRFFKPLPRPPAILSQQEYQTLFSSLEKIPSPPLPNTKFPEIGRVVPTSNGYLTAGVGLFPTIHLSTLYRFSLKGVELMPSASFEYSRGHRENAQYRLLHIRLDEKHNGILPIASGVPYEHSGRAEFKEHWYRLYAVPTAPQRMQHLFRWGSHVLLRTVVGELSVHPMLQWFRLSQDSSTRNEVLGGIQSTIKFEDLWQYPLEVALDLFMGNSFGTSFGGFTLQGSSKVQITEALAFQSSLGVSGNTTPAGRSLWRPILRSTLDYRVSPFFSFSGKIALEVQREHQQDLWQKNPYISIEGQSDYRTPLQISVLGWYHPTTSLSLTVQVNGVFGDLGTWIAAADSATFQRVYRKGQSLQLVLQGYWHFHPAISINGDIALTSAYANGRVLPYIPALKSTMQLQYHLNARTMIGVASQIRSILPTGEKNLLAFWEFSLFAHRKLQDRMDVQLGIHNVFNAPVYDWPGYRKRGIYAEVLLQWYIK